MRFVKGFRVRTPLIATAGWLMGASALSAQQPPGLPGFSLYPSVAPTTTNAPPVPAQVPPQPTPTNPPVLAPPQSAPAPLAPATAPAPAAVPPPTPPQAPSGPAAPSALPDLGLRPPKSPDAAKPRQPAAQCVLPMLTTSPRDKQGYCIPTAIRWTPRPSATSVPLRVSVSEDVAAGGGKLLRSSAWMAAMVASLELSIPLANGTFEIESRGWIDGPSAGGAFAAGLMCLLQGVPFPADLALTGSLGPDGSLGPVAGVPQKLAAAKAAGLRRVIVPACQRVALDDRDKEVDLAARARELGLEVLFAGDVHQAYEMATGRRVRPPDPPATQSASDPAVFDFLTRNCQEQIALHEKRRDDIERFLKQKNLRPAAKTLLAKIRSDFETGRKAFDANKRYVALEFLKDANAAFTVLEPLSQTGELTDNVRTAWQQRGEAVQEKITETLFRGRQNPTSLAAALVFSEEADWLFAASSRISRAQLNLEDVQRRIAAAGPSGKVRGSLRQEQDYFTILLIYASLYAEYQLGFRTLFDGLLASIATKEGQADPAAVHLWLPVLLQAHLANAEYFRAGTTLLSPDLRQQMLLDHRLAAFLDLTRMASEKWEGLASGRSGAQPGALPANVNELTACFLWANAYCEAALLQQKYVGLGGTLDKNLEWQTFNRPTLLEMLKLAEARSLASMTLARQARIDPSPLALLFEKASWLRDGRTDSEKLEALRIFWRIALLGRLCQALGR